MLETIGRWLHDGGGAQDALDDPQLHSAIMTFFRHPTDHSPPAMSPADEASVQHGFSLVKDNLVAVSAAFSTQTLRPLIRMLPALEGVTDVTSTLAPAFSAESPNVDALDPADLVSNLDAMALAAFRNVTQEVAHLVMCTTAKLI